MKTKYKSKREYVLITCRNKCFYCQKNFTDWSEFGVDHLFPQSRGGKHDNINLVLACNSCNSSKWAYSLPEWFDRISTRYNLAKKEVSYCKKVLKSLKPIL